VRLSISQTLNFSKEAQNEARTQGGEWITGCNKSENITDVPDESRRQTFGSQNTEFLTLPLFTSVMIRVFPSFEHSAGMSAGRQTI